MSEARDIKKKPRELVGHPLIIDEACLEKVEPVLSQLTVTTATWRQIGVGRWQTELSRADCSGYWINCTLDMGSRPLCRDI